MRKVGAHAGKSGCRLVSAFIGTAFAQNDAAEAKDQWRRVADHLGPKLPKLARLLDFTRLSSSMAPSSNLAMVSPQLR